MTNSRFILCTLIAFSLLAFGAQFLVEFSANNIATSCIILASALSVLLYIMWSGAIQSHPLSTFAIFGFCVTTQLGALLVQSIYWTPLISNLRQPIETFGTLALYQLIALSAHVIYRALSKLSKTSELGVIRSVLSSVGVYTIPSVGALWVMGVIGLLSLLVRSADVGTGGKVAQGIAFLAWAPLLIPIYVTEIGKDYCDVRRNYIFLSAYICIFFLYGMAVNARGVMFSGIVTVALFLLLRGLRSKEPISAARNLKVFVILLMLGALTVPMGYLASAMGVARKDRATATPIEMVEKTLELLRQPEKIASYGSKLSDSRILKSYDEIYLKNPMFSRFIETKFHDNALYFSGRLGNEDIGRLADVTADITLTTFPDPVLRALDIDIEKSNYYFSMGDYLSHLGGASQLGSYRIGSVFAQGQALFGSFFMVLYCLICFILFWALDIFSFRTPSGMIGVSVIGMLGVWKIFQYGITAESLQAIFMAVVRGVPQNIIIYALVFAVARLFLGMLGKGFSSVGRGYQVIEGR
jgi:hypothetical protein